MNKTYNVSPWITLLGYVFLGLGILVSFGSMAYEEHYDLLIAIMIVGILITLFSILLLLRLKKAYLEVKDSVLEYSNGKAVLSIILISMKTVSLTNGYLVIKTNDGKKTLVPLIFQNTYLLYRHLLNEVDKHEARDQVSGLKNQDGKGASPKAPIKTGRE